MVISEKVALVFSAPTNWTALLATGSRIALYTTMLGVWDASILILARWQIGSQDGISSVQRASF